MRRAMILTLFLALLWSGGSSAAPQVEPFLQEGKLAEGEKSLQEYLKDKTSDDQARFGLGVLQFVRCQEKLLQNLHRYGFRDGNPAFRMLGIRLPLPANPKPETLTNEAFRKILQTWLQDLSRAEATFAQVTDDDVKLPLHLGLIKLDRTGAGTRHVTLFQLLEQWKVPLPGKQAEFLINFDRGDVAWFRGYCHLLAAVGEIVLAHDTKGLFDSCATLFFPKVAAPVDPLLEQARAVPLGENVELAWMISSLQALQLKVKEPLRLATALAHLKTTLAQSRLMWKYILAETDDDHEWIPSPRQKGGIGVAVNKEMIDCWLAFVEECEALLDGKRLIPFWAGKDDRGVNLNMLFTAPRTLDVTGLLQGPAARPFLVPGQPTQVQVWIQMNQVFNNHPFAYGAYFN